MAHLIVKFCTLAQVSPELLSAIASSYSLSSQSQGETSKKVRRSHSLCDSGV
ncbi:hypothetical protein F7734_10325 [Scytonema sp. UIC 10036]|uniref:hypothetical protein n=1 Tax=Scytonema sp. UIC 10036 TaxID=2304196 RepID=UPI0012DACF45|nr:hypothetical protein [Scytonema sp. UIC 10036]MUG92823.1 hypothetical protein [Scytonema sp. UIC 10036]